MAWSYDLLDDAEKSLLARCSVFSGGFDLQSACAVAGSDDGDEYTVLDLLGTLVRKSLLVADRSSGRTRFSRPHGGPVGEGVDVAAPSLGTRHRSRGWSAAPQPGRRGVIGSDTAT